MTINFIASMGMALKTAPFAFAFAFAFVFAFVFTLESTKRGRMRSSIMLALRSIASAPLSWTSTLIIIIIFN